MHLYNKRNAIVEAFGYMLVVTLMTGIIGYATVISFTDIENTFGQTHTYLDIATQKNSEILTIQDTTVSATEIRIEVMNIGKSEIIIDTVSTPNIEDAAFTVETLEGTIVTQIDPKISHVIIVPDNTSPTGVMIITKSNNVWLIDLQ